MKHYKDSQINLYGFAPGQAVPLDLVEISESEHQQLIADQQAAHNQSVFDTLPWEQQRQYSYPSIGDQLDAIWKGGSVMEEMRQRIMDVKSKYPKV